MYLLVVVLYFRYCYSYQFNITIIVSIISFVNFKSTLLLFICESQPLKFSCNQQFFPCIKRQAFVFLHGVVYLFKLLLFCFLSWNHRLKIDYLIAFSLVTVEVKILFISILM